ncbi:SDR family oxidoreductase [Lysinibacillus sp. NPDC097162]|uniref:SDR family oxidoreductase n=1 Tax=Lysinibacillus sp. NPDC097162 TaxID=3364140 RepID=UPI0037FE599B
MKILVTGATGALGNRVVETLLKYVPADQIVASVRDTAKAEHLRACGVEVRQADFNEPGSLNKAFEGIDRVLIISTTEPVNEKRIAQHVNAINAAKRANVKLLAYTSGTKADETKLAMGLAHKATEEAIMESGIPYCILRNNLYLETELSTIKACLAGAPIVTNAGEGKMGFALRNDYADAAAAVLAGEGHENRVYELSGKPMTYDDLATEIGKVIEKDVAVKHVDDAGFAAFLKNAGMPEVMIPMLTATKASVRDGVLEIESNDLEALLQRPVTPIIEALKLLIDTLKK